MFQFENKFLHVEFAPESGGFPSRIAVKAPDGEIFLVPGGKESTFAIRLGNGKTLHPVLPEGYEPDRYALEECRRVQFDRIPFTDQYGAKSPDFFLTVRYEFWDDGTVFATSYFVCEKYMTDFSITSCRFQFDLDFSTFQRIGTPFGTQADMASSGNGTVLSDWKKDSIRTNFNFFCKREDGLGVYAELFMEDGLSTDREENHKRTEFFWREKKARVLWDFQSCEAAPDKRFEWAQLNSWGFLFRAAPQERRNPPLRMYHYIDNYENRMPSLHLLELLEEAGADVFVYHEAWRSDPVNFAVPWDPVALRKFIAEAHRRNIRVALYIRGHGELTTMEDRCDWFGMYLAADWDGLYADFGGAHNGGIDGKVRYRAHYLKIRAIRRTIGRYGLFYAHSGMLSSGIGLTPELIDGYVSGEGEHGALGDGRFLHESISGSYLTNGTFWTAAFPHYGDGRQVPYMASTGQYPHVPLGNQWKSSSLAHPGVPGINDLYLRDLWRLWGTFKNMRDLVYYTDYNSIGVLENPARERTGAYLQIDPAKKVALLILSNFDPVSRKCFLRVHWEKTVLGSCGEGDAVFALLPGNGEKAPEAVPYDSFTDFSMETAPNGVCGFLFGEKETLSPLLEEYGKPFPAPSREAEAHLKKVEEQKKLREAPSSPAEELYMKLVMPEAHVPFICVRAFHSLEHRIGVLNEKDEFVLLGYLTRHGFTKEKPGEGDWIWAEEESPWIPLREIFPQGGVHRVVIRSFGVLICGKGEYFHSLHTLILSPEKNEECKEAYRLIFLNEVEPERENFHFSVNLTTKA